MFIPTFKCANNIWEAQVHKWNVALTMQEDEKKLVIETTIALPTS
jgi:hypothetical protein